MLVNIESIEDLAVALTVMRDQIAANIEVDHPLLPLMDAVIEDVAEQIE